MGMEGKAESEKAETWKSENGLVGRLQALFQTEEELAVAVRAGDGAIHCGDEVGGGELLESEGADIVEHALQLLMPSMQLMA